MTHAYVTAVVGVLPSLKRSRHMNAVGALKNFAMLDVFLLAALATIAEYGHLLQAIGEMNYLYINN